MPSEPHVAHSAAPVWVGDVELSRGWAPRAVARDPEPDDDRARLLIRLHGHPLGFVELPATGSAPAPAEVRRQVLADLGTDLSRHLEADAMELPAGIDALPEANCALDPGSTGEPMTLVVCTRDRPDILRGCLGSVSQLSHPDFEVIVVDSASRGAGTAESFEREVGDDPRFHLVREDQPGLSRARNRGLAEAAHRLVAFTDDDVTVDADWLTRLDAGFARRCDVGCVTGLVPAARLDDAGQQYFEQRYSWSADMAPRFYDLGDNRDPSPLFPYSPGIFGTGANFAVDGPHLRSLGGFDEALGAGARAAGGEDLDAFVRILRSGKALVREPAAIVWHTHRSDPEELRRQLYTYGMGLSAFFTKQLFDRQTAGELLRRIPQGVRKAARIWGPLRRSDTPGPPPGVGGQELRGLVAGPLAYLRGRREL